MRIPDIHSHACYNQAHHAPGERRRFINPWRQNQRKPTAKGMAWVVSHLLTTNKSLQLLTGQPLLSAQNERLPCASICSVELAAPPPTMRVYWLGHATALIQVNGQTIVTDPVLGRQIGPLPIANSFLETSAKHLDHNMVLRAPRQPDIALPIERFPFVHVVLISHNHYDHLDKASVMQLARNRATLFVTPLGVGAYLRKWGVTRLVELDWWQYIEYQGIRYHCTPACHGSQRYFNDRYQSLWSGWFVETIEERSQTLFFAGDTAYAPHFQEIYDRLGPSGFALLPIGAYTPRWYLKDVHTDPGEALQAFVELNGRKLLPIHWGTFDLGQEPIHLPGQLLPEIAARRGIPLEKICTLPVGGAATL
jgi:L-ascorbate metabolism protein UlaG (beta-lactamase superfamily)